MNLAMEPITSWSELKVGKWYLVPGVPWPQKFGGAFIWDKDDISKFMKEDFIRPAFSNRHLAWKKASRLLPSQDIERAMAEYKAAKACLNGVLEFTDGKGAVISSIGLSINSELKKYVPVDSPRRRHGTNAERQAAYRKRLKDDRRTALHKGDRFMLPITGEDGEVTMTKFRVISVPESESDLRRGKSPKVRYADIRIERV